MKVQILISGAAPLCTTGIKNCILSASSLRNELDEFVSVSNANNYDIIDITENSSTVMCITW